MSFFRARNEVQKKACFIAKKSESVAVIKLNWLYISGMIGCIMLTNHKAPMLDPHLSSLS